MSRIGKRFQQLREQRRKALIPYVTAGDPRPNVTVPLLHALVKAGADIVEIGVPFSDPMADGPVIQAACERALAHHVSLHDVLDMVRIPPPGRRYAGRAHGLSQPDRGVGPRGVRHGGGRRRR